MPQLVAIGRLMNSRKIGAAPAPVLLPQTVALLAAMSVQPDAARTALINTLMGVLVDNSIFSAMDIFYMTTAHDAQAARLNWVAPSSYALVPVNSPTFTTDSGYQGDGLSSYLRTQYNASTNGVAFTLNAGSLGVISLTNDNTGMDMGAIVAASTFLQSRNGGTCGGRINNAGTATTSVQASGIGISIYVRDSSTTEKLYRDGSQIAAATVSASALVNREVILLGRNNATPTYGTKKLASGFQGGSLTPTQVANLTAGMKTFVNAISPGALP